MRNPTRETRASRPGDVPSGDLPRRVVLRSAAVGGLGLPLLAACGAGEEPGPTGGAKVAAADVPVGGGTILADDKIVVTQPSAGEFRAFSAVCTHQGCPVQSIAEGTINCPCHGSQFSVEDGSVVTGPATAPLEKLTATQQGEEIVVG
jgi:Rieske Fe-S protein